MQVRTTTGAVNRSKRGLEISAGRLVLNYDVDKTSEDTSQEIPTFRYRALSRVPYTRLERPRVYTYNANNQRNAKRSCK